MNLEAKAHYLEGTWRVAKTYRNPLRLKEKDNYLVVVAGEQGPGREGGWQKSEDRSQRTEDSKRCQAVTVKGRRCRNEGTVYRIYEADGLEYLSCKTHFQDFRPHPGQQGQEPPKEQW